MKEHHFRAFSYHDAGVHLEPAVWEGVSGDAEGTVVLADGGRPLIRHPDGLGSVAVCRFSLAGRPCRLVSSEVGSEWQWLRAWLGKALKRPSA